MIICGIETSCDETSVAFFDSSFSSFYSATSSQIDLHNRFGGVVPEIASRNHLLNIKSVYNEALQKAGIATNNIDLIGVTYSPGLIGALFVGVSFAKGLSYGLNKPIVGINHLYAHILAGEIENHIYPPYLGVVISGGHTHIFKVDCCYNFYLLGRTIDDAAGETFDKIARFANLPYPGGPEIEKLAIEGDENSIVFPVALKNTMDFSFSGLKTNVINTIAGKKFSLEDICASFQKTVAITLSEKINEAVRQTALDTVIISGGVACNDYLRRHLPLMINAKIFFPSKKLCTDNGDMVAYTAYRLYRKKAFLGFDKTAADSLDI